MAQLSHSSIQEWLACRLKWDYSHRPDQAAPPEVSSNLLRGTAGHAALEQFYNASPENRTLDLLTLNFGQALTEATDELRAVIEFASWQEDEVAKAHDQGLMALCSFWDTFHQDKGVPAMKVEVRLSAWLGVHELRGILDGISVEHDRLVMWEHKFPYSFPSAAMYRHWSPQGRVQALLLGACRKELDLPDLPIVSRFTVCSPRKAGRFEDVLHVTQALDEAQRVVQIVGEEMGGQVYPNYGMQCFRCPFKGLCLARITGGDA